MLSSFALVIIFIATTVLGNEAGIGNSNFVTSKNADKKLVKDNLSLVLFYAPWQKECTPKVEIVDQLSQKYNQGGDSGVFVGKADVYNDLKLAARFMIEDYCVLKYFIKGSDVAETYQGNLTTAEELDEFIISISSTGIDENDFKQSLIKLDTETFTRYVRDKSKTAIVLFHAKWCKKCLVLLKTLSDVARRFKKEPDCVFAHIDGEQNYDISLSEKVGLYPTFMFYPRENKDGVVYLPGKFEEKWSEKNITKFMSVHCKSKMADDHVFDKLMGRINDLDVFTRNFIVRLGNPNEQERIIRKTVLKIQLLEPGKRFTANFYVETMRDIMKQGISFLDVEITKIDKMMLSHDEHLMPKDKDEMNEKRNILHHFRTHKNQHRRDEL